MSPCELEVGAGVDSKAGPRRRVTAEDQLCLVSLADPEKDRNPCDQWPVL